MGRDSQGNLYNTTWDRPAVLTPDVFVMQYRDLYFASVVYDRPVNVFSGTFEIGGQSVGASFERLELREFDSGIDQFIPEQQTLPYVSYDTSGVTPADEMPGFWGAFWGSIHENSHTALDVAGMLPIVGEVADGFNGLIYLAEGDPGNAAMSFGAMVPFAGNFVTGGKWAKKAAGAAGDLGKQAIKQVDNIPAHLKQTKNGVKVKEIKIDGNKYPESAQHLKDAGYDNKTVIVDRAGAAKRRRDALSDVEPKPKLDRDEMPPAIFKEGSQSVRHISPADNRGAGASIGNQLRGTPDGVKVRIKVDP